MSNTTFHRDALIVAYADLSEAEKTAFWIALSLDVDATLIASVNGALAMYRAANNARLDAFYTFIDAEMNQDLARSEAMGDEMMALSDAIERGAS